MSDVQNEFQAGQNELADAQRIANQPAQPVATPGVYAGPHARLLNMVQGLAEGISAFGTAIATHGREGGAPEVQQLQLQRQSAQMAAQRQAQEQKSELINQKVNMAHAHMAQMQYQMGLMKLPTELKEEALGLSNATVDSFTKLYDTAQQMGYDPDDPQQMEEARQRIGLDPTKSDGAITVPFAAGQSTAATTQAVQGALPPGKSLTDYSVFVKQNANAHGQGGQVVLLPTQGQLMQMPATPRQIAATQAESAAMIEQAKAAGLSDDPNSPNYNPQFAQFQGDYNTLKGVLANGGKPTSLQIHNLHMAVAGPLTTLVAGKTQAAKIRSEQQSAEASNPVAKLATPEALAAPGAQAAIQAKIDDPTTDPNDIPRLRGLLPKAAVAQNNLMNQKLREQRAQQILTQGNPDAAGQLLANRSLTLDELKSRQVTPQFIEAAVSAAQKYDPTFKAAEASGQAAIAKSAANQQFFGNTDSLLVKGGTLDQLQSAANNLGNTQIPAFNTLDNWRKAALGKGPQAAYAAAALGVADDYSKVMTGGQGSDTSRLQALNIINRDLSPEGRAAAIAQIRQAVESQRQGRVGTNPYLRDMYPDPNTTRHAIGDRVTLRNGQQVVIKSLNPDGTFTY